MRGQGAKFRENLKMDVKILKNSRKNVKRDNENRKRKRKSKMVLKIEKISRKSKNEFEYRKRS